MFMLLQEHPYGLTVSTWWTHLLYSDVLYVELHTQIYAPRESSGHISLFRSASQE
jgi:hypothetical protein